MIFYILIGISIILICLIIFVFYKDIKGKHKKKKSPPTKKPLNYSKEPIKKEICLLNKNALREDLTSRSIIISKDINMRKEMARKMQENFDGKGAKRVAEEIEKYINTYKEFELQK